MKQFFKHLCTLSLIFLLSAIVPIVNASCGSSCSSSCNDCCDSSCNSCGYSCCNDCDDCGSDNDVYCKSYFAPRSQGLDGARLLAGRHNRMHMYDKDEFYGTIDVALAYQRSFNTEKQGRYLSPNCGCNTFKVGADNQTGVDVRNHDFGVEGTGTITLCPRIENFIADIQGFFGFNSWAEGLYLDIQLPIVHTWWNSNCCVNEDAAFSANFLTAEGNSDGCLMDINGADAATGTTSLLTAMQGGFKWGSVANELCYGKICCGKQSDTRLAELRLRVGYDFLLKENYHLGLAVVMAAPTGTRPGMDCQGSYLWQPIAGNSAMWEIGGALTGHAVLWDKDDDKSFSFHANVEATTMFKSRCQKRTFDLKANDGYCNRCFSRYLLFKKFDANGNIESLERGPNILTQEINVKANIQVDATALFSFKYNRWMADFGYNGWFRSAEKLDDCTCCCIADDTYGIKGELNSCGSYADQDYTASTSTIRVAGTADATQTFISCSDTGYCSDIDYCTALHPSAHSHAVFGHFAYVWEDNDWAPTVGVGAKGEWSGKGNRAVDQWEVWGKLGVAF